jgi:hypothetical protein
MNMYLITPCPVCGLEQECPHTPVRCQHNWKYDGKPTGVGTHRECYGCGRVERAKIAWDTVKA